MQTKTKKGKEVNTESTHDKPTIKQNEVKHASLKLIPFQGNDGKIYAANVQVGTVDACLLRNKD